MLESDLQKELLLVQPHRIPQLRLFRRNVGVAEMHGHRVRFAIKGQCDLWGVTRSGMHLELELKGPRGRLNPDQERWRDFCVVWGVPWLLLQAKAEETVQGSVERWIEEIATLLRRPM